jgi:hypothetical protein
MSKYTVYDNDRLACYPHHAVDSSWNNASFNTLKEAREYAHNWLGVYSPGVDGFKPNVPYDYSGYGDIIEIRQEITEKKFWIFKYTSIVVGEVKIHYLGIEVMGCYTGFGWETKTKLHN